MFAAVLAAEPGAALDPAALEAAALEAIARDFSPRIESYGGREVVLDVHGLDRLIGDPPTVAAELRRAAADRGLRVRVAIAGSRTAARLLAHARPGITLVGRDDERRALAPLAIDLLAVVAEDPDLATLRRWGLRTLGSLGDLPDDAVAARLGRAGVAWQRLARGEDPCPLVPAVPEERFEQALDLEWPIDELEPLSFVLGRLMEPLSAHLERRGRAAAVLRVRLHLIRTDGAARAVHERTLQLPAPIRDARTLRTLALLDLESNPPPAAIDRVVVAVDPTPGRVVQFSLLTRPLPSPERLSTLMARLSALMGEERCGAPADVDSWRPGAFGMRPFAPGEAGGSAHPGSHFPHATCEVAMTDRRLPTTDRRPPAADRRAPAADRRAPAADRRVPAADRRVSIADSRPPTAGPVPLAAGFRRFRQPLPIRVSVEDGRPVRVTTLRRELPGGRVVTSAGPWRGSGVWWDADHWNRDEWEVALAGGETYRIFHDRDSGKWFLDGVVD